MQPILTTNSLKQSRCVSSSGTNRVYSKAMLERVVAHGHHRWVKKGILCQYSSFPRGHWQKVKYVLVFIRRLHMHHMNLQPVIDKINIPADASEIPWEALPRANFAASRENFTCNDMSNNNVEE